jgi:mRNA interferase MazF
MQKDFEGWGKLKIILNDRETRNEYNRVVFGCYSREIWVCSIGINIGSELDGKNITYSRPVLVLKVFNPEMFWGIPLTTKGHDGDFYYKFNLGGIDNVAVLSQISLFSTKRLDRKVAVLPKKMFVELCKKFIKLVENEIPLAGEISEAEALVNLE